jgi:hypothetical protein
MNHSQKTHLDPFGFLPKILLDPEVARLGAVRFPKGLRDYPGR